MNPIDLADPFFRAPDLSPIPDRWAGKSRAVATASRNAALAALRREAGLMDDAITAVAYEGRGSFADAWASDVEDRAASAWMASCLLFCLAATSALAVALFMTGRNGPVPQNMHLVWTVILVVGAAAVALAITASGAFGPNVRGPLGLLFPRIGHLGMHFVDRRSSKLVALGSKAVYVHMPDRGQGPITFAIGLDQIFQARSEPRPDGGTYVELRDRSGATVAFLRDARATGACGTDGLGSFLAAVSGPAPAAGAA